jgi:hypothetical protein
VELLLILWLLMGAVSGVIASNKGRSGLGFGLLGVFFGPIGIIAAALVSPIVARPVQGLQKRCPECAEVVQSAAKVCRYCGHRFSEQSESEAILAAPVQHPEPTLMQKLFWNPNPPPRP